MWWKRDSKLSLKAMYFVTDEEDDMRFYKAYTGVMRNPRVEDDIKSRYLEEGLFSIRVTIMGPNLCLLEDLVGNDVASLVSERKEWWNQFFVSINPWKPSDVDYERIVWINLFGIPCNAWGESFFSVLAEPSAAMLSVMQKPCSNQDWMWPRYV